MIIHVTKEHIKRGKRRSSTECPTALAINEQTGLTTFVGLSILFCLEARPYRVLTESRDSPGIAEVFKSERQFHANGTMEPYSFELPDNYLKINPLIPYPCHVNQSI